MNTRRSFCQRIAGLVAAVAIAPEIAFRTKLALPEAEQQLREFVMGMDVGDGSSRMETWTFRIERDCEGEYYVMNNPQT